MTSIPAEERTWKALGPTLPVNTSLTPWFAIVWAAWMPAPLAASWLVLGMASTLMFSESTITKYWLLPNLGSIGASRLPFTADTAIFKSLFSCLRELFQSLLDGIQVRLEENRLLFQHLGFLLLCQSWCKRRCGNHWWNSALCRSRGYRCLKAWCKEPPARPSAI